MIQELGIMLCKEREKMGEKQKSVAQGIISIPKLSKLERGALEIDSGSPTLSLSPSAKYSRMLTNINLSLVSIRFLPFHPKKH